MTSIRRFVLALGLLLGLGASANAQTSATVLSYFESIPAASGAGHVWDLYSGSGADIYPGASATMTKTGTCTPTQINTYVGGTFCAASSGWKNTSVSVTSNRQVTVAGAIKLGTSANLQCIYCVTTTSSYWNFQAYLNSSGHFYTSLYGTGGTLSFTSSGTYNDSAAHVFVVAMDGAHSACTVYLDGSSIGTCTGSTSGQVEPAVMEIGSIDSFIDQPNGPVAVLGSYGGVVASSAQAGVMMTCMSTGVCGSSVPAGLMMMGVGQ